MRKATIIGFGVMGSSLAQLLAQKGYQVVGLDNKPDALALGTDTISNGRFGLNKLLNKGKISESELKSTLQRITVTTDLKSAVSDAEIVIENVDENLELKKKIFSDVDRICSPDTILATDTTCLSITSIASHTIHPERVIGLHFFIPPQIMPLVEVIAGMLTSTETLAFANKFCLDIGKEPIASIDRPGFIVARLSLCQFKEASLVLEEGISTAKEIDDGVRKGLGSPLGPFELTDLIGLDTRLAIFDSMFDETGDPKWKAPILLKHLVESNYLGDPKLKNGSRGGYYEYFGLERSHT